MAQGRAARADLREPRQGAGSEERPQGASQAGQGRRLDRDRDRLRPRGRADRPRGARGDPRREPRSCARIGERSPPGVKRAAVLGADQGGDRRCVHQPRRAVRAAGPRRRGAPGHRPDLGRDADALRVARDRAGSARSSCPSAVCRARRSRSSSSASSSAARTCPKPFWEVFAAFEHPDGEFTAHHKVDKFWEEAEAKAALENTSTPGRRQVGRVEAQHAQAAVAVQHDRVHERRVVGGRLAGARDAHRRGPLHGRLHLLSAHRQHRVSEVAAGAGAAAVDLAGVRVQGGGAARRA